jgi:hypothetical protein
MKNIFTAAIIATAALCTVDAVSALGARANSNILCDTVEGFHACIDYSSDADVMHVGDPQGREETIVIQCFSGGGWKYESEGQWTKYEVEEWVKGYCEGRGPAH